MNAALIDSKKFARTLNAMPPKFYTNDFAQTFGLSREDTLDLLERVRSPRGYKILKKGSDRTGRTYWEKTIGM